MGYKLFIYATTRATDKVRIFISIMSISSPNPMFDHLLESSHQDDSIKWSIIGFGEEITQANKTRLKLLLRNIWSPVYKF